MGEKFCPVCEFPVEETADGFECQNKECDWEMSHEEDREIRMEEDNNRHAAWRNR